MAVTNTNYNDDKRFSKENVSLSNDFPVKYATFNAYQMRDLIIRKLTEDPAIREQVYPGSNISILIDLVSTMYQTLTYQLNHAASESMFSQSQYYENIVRIAKLIGYNAQGITPSTAMFRVQLDDESTDVEIKPFSCVTTQDGKYYSYSPRIMLNCSISRYDNSQDILLHNGKWKRYPIILTPTGEDFETFVLPTVRSEMDAQKYATTSHIFAIEVIKSYTQLGDVDWSATKYITFHPTNWGLFKNLPNGTIQEDVHNFLYNGYGMWGDSFSNQENNVFNVELNEIKQLVIKFGDGVTTRKLTPNSELYVFYLDTQGMDGQIMPSDEELTFEHNAEMLDLDSNIYNLIFNDRNSDVNNEIHCKSISSSTSAIREEGVDEVREKAPHWFKMNNRLVTKEDYQFFVMNEPYMSSVFNQVKVMNNWEYVSTFYRWLNQLGVSRHGYPRFYLNPARFTKYGGASLSDAVDSNNVYIWYITNFGDIDDIHYDQVIQRCKSMMWDLKDMCHEPVFLPAVQVRCEISSVPLELGRGYLQANNTTTLPLLDKEDIKNYYIPSWLEIRINEDYSISPNEVVDRVCSIFQYFFDVRNNMIGFGGFNTNDIMNMIFDKIPAVSDIYTVFQNGKGGEKTYTHGISMASFVTNTSLINLGDDLQIKSGNIGLEQFMFPTLYTNDISQRIKVVSKNINILSKVNY